MTTLRHLAAAGVLAVLTSLVACSGDDGGSAATTSVTTSPAATTTTAAGRTTTSSAATSTSTASTVPETTTAASTTAPPTTSAPPTTAAPPGTRPSLAPGCPSQPGGLATLTIGIFELAPQCLSIYPHQSLRIVNNASGDAQLTFGDVYTTPVMGPGDITTTEPVGTGLGRNKALTVVCTCYPDNQGTLLIAP